MNKTFTEARRAEANPNLPPPNWSPTGNEGWWVRDDPTQKWKWVDDVYGHNSAEEFKKEQMKNGVGSGSKRKKWWEVWK